MTDVRQVEEYVQRQNELVNKIKYSLDQERREEHNRKLQ